MPSRGAQPTRDFRARGAVDLYRTLAKVAPHVHLGDLASSLTTQAFVLAGRPTDALPPAGEAVDLYRALAQVTPDAYLPDLAASLVSLATVLAVRSRADALPFIREAVDLYRTLAEAVPDAYRPQLALALTHMAVVLIGVGRPADALHCIQEAWRSCRAASGPTNTWWILPLARLGRASGVFRAVQDVARRRKAADKANGSTSGDGVADV